jgi:hypothetical protein
VLVDLPLDELRSYRPEVDEPADFDTFWAEQLSMARGHDLDVEVVPLDAGLATVEVSDVTLPGHGGDPIRAWYLRPRERSGPLPTVVDYLHYGTGRGLPHERLLWSAAGYAHPSRRASGRGPQPVALPRPLPPRGRGHRRGPVRRAHRLLLHPPRRGRTDLPPPSPTSTPSTTRSGRRRRRSSRSGSRTRSAHRRRSSPPTTITRGRRRSVSTRSTRTAAEAPITGANSSRSSASTCRDARTRPGDRRDRDGQLSSVRTSSTTIITSRLTASRMNPV